MLSRRDPSDRMTHPPHELDWSVPGLLGLSPRGLLELSGMFPAVEGELTDLARLDPQTQSGRRFGVAGIIAAKMNTAEGAERE